MGAMDAPVSLRGQYLLAMPGIGDPRFEKAVIAMCAHDEQGALGHGRRGRSIPAPAAGTARKHESERNQKEEVVEETARDGAADRTPET